MTPLNERLGWEQLAAAVIEQAVWDFKNPKANNGTAKHLITSRKETRKSQAGDFFFSDYFEGLARFVRVEPDAVRERLGLV